MARTTTDLVYAVTGQTFAYRATQGRPTSATFSVFDDDVGDDDAAEFTGTATVDSVNTTVSSASGASQTDPNKLSITSTNGVAVGVKYLVSEASMQEWVVPVEIQSGYIRLRYPLKNDYTTAATFVSTTVSGTVDSTWVATLAKVNDPTDANPGYRVRWSIVINGTTYIAYSYLTLQRAQISHQVDADDIAARAPGWLDNVPTDYIEEQGRPVIDSAWRVVQARFSALGIDTSALRDDQVVDELVILASLNVIALGGWRPGGFATQAEYVAVTSSQFDRFFEQHFQSMLHHKIAASATGASEVVASKPIWGK